MIMPLMLASEVHDVPAIPIAVSSKILIFLTLFFLSSQQNKQTTSDTILLLFVLLFFLKIKQT